MRAGFSCCPLVLHAAMARVFANQELVLGIAKGFIGNLYPRDDFLYVQTFSQVCHATRGPALDFWWHTQYSLYHILRTFGDAVQYTNIAPRKRHIVSSCICFDVIKFG